MSIRDEFILFYLKRFDACESMAPIKNTTRIPCTEAPLTGTRNTFIFNAASDEASGITVIVMPAAKFPLSSSVRPLME